MSLFTKQQVATIIGVSKRTVETLIYSRKIAHRRVGSQVRFTQADVDAYLENCRMPTIEELSTPARRRKSS